MAATQPYTATALGISVAATAAALTAVALPQGTDAQSGNSIRVFNEGPNVCWFALGGAGVLATLPATGAGVRTCVPVGIGEDLILSRNPSADLFISTICRASGTATLTVSIGDGQ